MGFTNVTQNITVARQGDSLCSIANYVASVPAGIGGVAVLLRNILDNSIFSIQQFTVSLFGATISGTIPSTTTTPSLPCPTMPNSPLYLRIQLATLGTAGPAIVLDQQVINPINLPSGTGGGGGGGGGIPTDPTTLAFLGVGGAIGVAALGLRIYNYNRRRKRRTFRQREPSRSTQPSDTD